jgi:hypothetical protein
MSTQINVNQLLRMLISLPSDPRNIAKRSMLKESILAVILLGGWVFFTLWINSLQPIGTISYDLQALKKSYIFFDADVFRFSVAIIGLGMLIPCIYIFIATLLPVATLKTRRPALALRQLLYHPNDELFPVLSLGTNEVDYGDMNIQSIIFLGHTDSGYQYFEKKLSFMFIFLYTSICIPYLAGPDRIPSRYHFFIGILLVAGVLIMLGIMGIPLLRTDKRVRITSVGLSFNRNKVTIPWTSIRSIYVVKPISESLTGQALAYSEKEQNTIRAEDNDWLLVTDFCIYAWHAEGNSGAEKNKRASNLANAIATYTQLPIRDATQLVRDLSPNTEKEYNSANLKQTVHTELSYAYETAMPPITSLRPALVVSVIALLFYGWVLWSIWPA